MRAANWKSSSRICYARLSRAPEVICEKNGLSFRSRSSRSRPPSPRAATLRSFSLPPRRSRRSPPPRRRRSRPRSSTRRSARAMRSDTVRAYRARTPRPSAVPACPGGTGYVPDLAKFLAGSGAAVTLNDLGISGAVLGPDVLTTVNMYGALGTADQCMPRTAGVDAYPADFITSEPAASPRHGDARDRLRGR